MNDINLKIFIKNSRLRMSELGIKPKQLSKLLGVSPPYISAYLSGKRKPKRETLVRFSEALKCDPDWLAGYEVTQNNETNVYQPGELEKQKLELIELILSLKGENVGNTIAHLTTIIEGFVAASGLDKNKSSSNTG